MTTIWSGYNLVSCLHAQGTEVVNEPQELDVGDLFSSFTDVSWGSLLTTSVMVFSKDTSPSFSEVETGWAEGS